MKRVRVHNKVLFFSWFDFSEMAIAIPCGIILARLLTLSLHFLLGWGDAANLCFTTSQ